MTTMTTVTLIRIRHVDLHNLVSIVSEKGMRIKKEGTRILKKTAAINPTIGLDPVGGIGNRAF